MRKSVFASLFIALLVVLFFLLNPSAPPSVSPEHSETESEVKNDRAQTPTPTRPRWTRPVREESSSDVPQAEDSVAILYGPAEFARGELQNVVIENGIRLGDNPSFVPRFNPAYKLFGNFISPEETVKEPFNLLHSNIQVSDLGNNEVSFEIRTKGVDGFWSEWQEVTPEQMKEPIPVNMEAIGWQYRLTLFANDAASSPRVDTISLGPISSKAKNFSSNSAR